MLTKAGFAVDERIPYLIKVAKDYGYELDEDEAETWLEIFDDVERVMLGGEL